MKPLLLLGLAIGAALAWWALRPRPVPARLERWEEGDDALPPFDPEVIALWQAAIAHPEPLRVIGPAPAAEGTFEPWYVGPCGFAHPWGVCHGHEYTWLR